MILANWPLYPLFPFHQDDRERTHLYISPSGVCKAIPPTSLNRRPTSQMQREGTRIPPPPNKIMASQLRLPENQHSRHINKKHLAMGRGLTQHRQAVVDLWLRPRVTRTEVKSTIWRIPVSLGNPPPTAPRSLATPPCSGFELFGARVT